MKHQQNQERNQKEADDDDTQMKTLLTLYQLSFLLWEMLKVLYESLSDYTKKAKDHIYEYLKSHKYWNKD